MGQRASTRARPNNCRGPGGGGTEPVHIPDIRDDPEYSYGGPTEYYRSMLAVPIMVEDDLIGVVVLVRREPQPFTDEHIALVQTFADQAAIAVANARLIEAVERQRTELARFVSPQVAELLSSRDGEQLLAGHRAYISCLFCDLRGFTAFVETAAPEELFDVLREYHAVLGELIPAHEGTLEHFAGDGVMVFFNDPLPVGITSSRPFGSPSPHKSGSRSWPGSGASAELSSGSASGSKPATRRSGESGSKGATTTASSDRWRTSPHGSASRRPRARS